MSQRYPSELASYFDLFQRTLDYVFLLDLESFSIRDANAVAERMLDCERERLCGKNLLEWIPELEHQGLEKYFRSARRSYYPKKVAVPFRLGDGRMLRLDLVISKLSLSDGQEVIQVIAQDITSEYELQQKNEQYLRQLQELATTDGLTQLSNHRYFQERLRQEHQRALRFAGTFAIVFCDVDHFKSYNDDNGHLAGDALLRALSVIIGSSCRTVDLPARYGGDEFAILCPSTPVEGAMTLAERIQRKVAETEFPKARTQPLRKITLSVGVAAFPESGFTPEDILEAADQAVYASKRAGRDRVTASPRKGLSSPA